MRTLTTIIIFSYLKIMYAVDNSNAVEESKTVDTRKLLTDDNITLEEAAEEIAEIKSNEVLPLILFTNFTELQYPNRLEFAVTKHRRIVNETKFIPRDPGIQRFLCPMLNSDRKCFVAKKFEEWQTLRCPDIERATPIFQEFSDGQRCGPGKVGRIYVATYDICPEEELHQWAKKEDTWLYLLCYNEKDGKTLFTCHTMMSPNLLNSKLLHRERQIEYPMVTNDQININLSNYEEGLLYKVQRLTPPEDMPFALWRKATYQYVNAELQHEKLTELWDDINEYIRSYFLKLYLDSERKREVALNIYTGVIEVSSVPRDDNQKSNMWVKTVFIHDDPDPSPSGIAILMNNFIDTKEDESKLSEENLEIYCEVDLCASALKEEFERVKGHIRVCALTPQIAKLFGIEDEYNARKSKLEVLYIPSINEVNKQ